jgi:hypothetical protein
MQPKTLFILAAFFSSIASGAPVQTRSLIEPALEYETNSGGYENNVGIEKRAPMEPELEYETNSGGYINNVGVEKRAEYVTNNSPGGYVNNVGVEERAV